MQSEHITQNHSKTLRLQGVQGEVSSGCDVREVFRLGCADEAEREFANRQNFVKDALICRTSKTKAH
jgi:hypothetical protein